MVADMLNNKNLNPIVTELFIRGRALNISIVFITKSHFAVPKHIKLNSTHYFIMKCRYKRELQQIAINHSSDIDFQDFMNLYRKSTEKPYSFLVIDTTLASDNPSRFRRSLLERIKLKTKNQNMILIEKQKKYWYYHLEKLINLNEYLTDEEILPSGPSRIIEQAKFTFPISVKHLKNK